MNENGDETYSGTTSAILINGTSITVENLMPGTVYNFRTKVEIMWNTHVILLSLSDLQCNVRSTHLRGLVTSPLELSS